MATAFLSTLNTFAQSSLLACGVQFAAVTSPVAVDFWGLVAGQPPNVIDGQAGRPVSPERQRGEPVQGHEGEEAGVVDGVLMPGNKKGKKREGGVRKATASRSAGACAAASQGRRKVRCSRSVWTVICMLFTEIWVSSEKNGSGGRMWGEEGGHGQFAISRRVFTNSAVCRRRISSHPLSWPPAAAAAAALTFNTSGSKRNKMWHCTGVFFFLFVPFKSSYLSVNLTKCQFFLLPFLNLNPSDSCRTNMKETVVFTCELSWRALEAAGSAGIGPVSWVRSRWAPRPPPPPARATAAGPTVADPPPVRLLPGHRGTWRHLWGRRSRAVLILFSNHSHKSVSRFTISLEAEGVTLMQFFHKHNMNTYEYNIISWLCPLVFW